jgi:PAS domain S-box-containing protein
MSDQSPPVEARLQRAHAALLQLARSKHFLGTSLAQDLKQLSEIAAYALHVARASIWLFDPAHLKIRCVNLFDADAGTHSGGQELLKKDHAAYFAALEDRRLIVAHDASTDPATCQFRDDYLKPLGITSMLDAAIRQRGGVIGVICLEHIGPARRWTTEEEVFACALADLVSLAIEVSERRTLEQTLRETERRFRQIFENSRTGMALIGVEAEGRRFVCEELNPQAEQWTGLSQERVRGKTAIEFLPASVAQQLEDRFRECLRVAAPLQYEHELPLAAGARWFNTVVMPIRDERGTVRRLACIAEDITERVRMERERQHLQEQLHRTRKLEAIGTLAGGVAHDFNNFLTGIFGYVELLQRKMEGNPAAADMLKQVGELAGRARDLVRQVLAIGRKDTPSRLPTDLKEVVQSALKHIQVTLPPQVRLAVEMAPGSMVVTADPTQMHQVMVNLCTNAVHALGERGGELRISLKRLLVSSNIDVYQGTLRPGQYVSLTVSDNGCGMEPATMERLFEPFFTTKPAGQGTGLGLATVYSVVGRHDGGIVVSSQPGQGAVFQIYLPALSTFTAHAAGAAAPPLSGHGRRVLLVDDQQYIADFAQLSLAGQGFQVQALTDPAAALRAFQANPRAFDLILIDYYMPQMNGLELVQRLRTVRDDVPIVLMSGFAGALDEQRLALAGVREILPKPFTMQTLSDVLQRVLC